MPQEKRTKSFSKRRLFALITKEFQQILRDPSSFLIAVILPAILLFLYGYGVSLDAKKIKTGLVLEDTSPEAHSFARSYLNSEYFDVQIGKTKQEYIQEMLYGSIDGLIVVPSYFSQFRERPASTAPIQLIADGSEPNSARFFNNYSTGAFLNWLKQENVSSDTSLNKFLIRTDPRYWYNEELDSHHFLIPGSIAIIMTLIGTLLTSLVIAREWERGSIEAIISTPVSVFEIILGKIIPYFILGMGSMIFSVFIAVVFFEIPYRGSWLALVFVSSCFLLTALGTGLMISTLTKNQFAASQAALVSAFLPAFILSGFIFEITSMPLPIQWVTLIVPARYFVTCLQTLFLTGNVWSLILKNVGYIILLGVLPYLITVKKTVKRLD